MDLFEKRANNIGHLGTYAYKGDSYFYFPKLEGEISNFMNFRGKEKLVWSLNNYLGLANHPEVRKADADAAREWGLGAPMGARMMSGQTTLHENLEKQLAEFVHKEDAYLLNYGYPGMVSIIDSLLNRNDVVVYDSEAHACIFDGIRLHLGKRFVYPHNDMEKLRLQLKHAEGVVEKTGGGILVITEGVYGMAGDLGKIDEIVKLKSEFSFRLLVDDAHGFGTMGKTGAGTPEHFGVQDQVDVHFATFAKSMAGIGAFVASTQEVIDFLQYDMRSQIYAKSLPMPMVIGSLKRLELIRTQPQLKQQLWTIVDALQNGLKDHGLDIGNTQSPVTPVFLKGGVPEATQLTIDLRENYNIFCSIVIYPVVPKDVIMLRLIPTAIHTIENVNYTIKAFTDIQSNLASGKYSSGIFPEWTNL